ncbi:transcriptional regulator, partial [Halorubrum sp. SP9]
MNGQSDVPDVPGLSGGLTRAEATALR